MGKEDRRFFPIPLETQAPPEYGIDASTVKIKTINLAVARATPQRIEIAGSVLWAVTATSIMALANVALGDAMLAGDPLPVRQGFFVRGVRFSRIFITNLAQAGETITLMMAEEGPDNIQIENPAVMYSEMSLIKATLFQSLTDVIVPSATPTIIDAVYADKRILILRSLSTNTAEIRINEGAALMQGIPLYPGDSVSLPMTCLVSAYQESGVDQIVAGNRIRD